MNIALLKRLRGALGEFVACESLGDAAALQHDLDELEAFGFGLERHPYRGVAFRSPAERLCPDQIEFELGTKRVGRRIAVWNRVASTNDLAARAAVSMANEGLVILAEEQTTGRGRRGRVWHAPARTSVLMSVVLFPPEPLCDPAWLTALGAVAVAEAVGELTGCDAAIKWPNDVRVAGLKLAGILVECNAGAVIGIGVNTNMAQDDFPVELRQSATSIRALSGSTVDRSDFIHGLIRRLDSLYDDSLRDGPTVVALPWRERSEHLGRTVRVETPSGPVTGRLEDISLGAGLKVATPGGSTIRIAARQVLAIADAPP